MEELNLEEMFDFNPILPQLYAFHLESKPEPGSIGDLNDQQLMSWNKYPNNNNNSQLETIVTPNLPPSSSPSPQLISFENSNNTSSYDINPVPPNADILINYTSSQIISFASHSDQLYDHEGRLIRQKKKKRERELITATRTPSQAYYDHLMAERRHRENLRQLFFTLSKLVPGLNKLDKASLLEDATNYLKALQERVNILEEEGIKKSSIINPVIIIKQEYSSSCKETISYDGSRPGKMSTSELVVPEINARISDNHVLIKICCKKEMGLMSRIPFEMEKMHLSVVDMRMMPFGGAALDITILAETQSGFRGTVKDIVDQLQRIFSYETVH